MLTDMLLGSGRCTTSITEPHGENISRTLVDLRALIHGRFLNKTLPRSEESIIGHLLILQDASTHELASEVLTLPLVPRPEITELFRDGRHLRLLILGLHHRRTTRVTRIELTLLRGRTSVTRPDGCTTNLAVIKHLRRYGSTWAGTGLRTHTVNAALGHKVPLKNVMWISHQRGLKSSRSKYLLYRSPNFVSCSMRRPTMAYHCSARSRLSSALMVLAPP